MAVERAGLGGGGSGVLPRVHALGQGRALQPGQRSVQQGRVPGDGHVPSGQKRQQQPVAGQMGAQTVSGIAPPPLHAAVGILVGSAGQQRVPGLLRG